MGRDVHWHWSQTEPSELVWVHSSLLTGLRKGTASQLNVVYINVNTMPSRDMIMGGECGQTEKSI